MTVIVALILIVLAAAGLWLAAGLIRRQRRWLREQRRMLAMQEQIARNIGHPRTGNVEHLGSRRP